MIEHCKKEHPGSVWYYLNKETMEVTKINQLTVRIIVQHSLRSANVFSPFTVAMVNALYDKNDDRPLRYHLGFTLGQAASSIKLGLTAGYLKDKVRELTKKNKVRELDSASKEQNAGLVNDMLREAIEVVTNMSKLFFLFDFRTTGQLKVKSAFCLMNMLNLFFRRGLFFDRVFPPILGLCISDRGLELAGVAVEVDVEMELDFNNDDASLEPKEEKSAGLTSVSM
jgi:hypothetical protein